MKPIRIGRVRIDAEKRIAAFLFAPAGWRTYVRAEIDRAAVCSRHSTMHLYTPAGGYHE
jgi:hypothetical protein